MLSTHSSLTPCFCAAASLTTYVSLVYLHRYRSLYRLEDLAPPTTAEEAFPILDNFICCDYPLFSTLSLEIGFLKTYGIPSISSILAGSRELVERYE